MQGALDGKPIEEFQNVVPLQKVALTKTVKVDTPDSAPTEAGESPVNHGETQDNPPTVPDKNLPGEAPAKIAPPVEVPTAAPSPRG
jgi:hypothetical protein